MIIPNLDDLAKEWACQFLVLNQFHKAFPPSTCTLAKQESWDALYYHDLAALGGVVPDVNCSRCHCWEIEFLHFRRCCIGMS